VEYVVNLPLSRKFQSVSQIRELILDSEQSVTFTHKFWGWLIGCKVGSFEPNRISDLETGIIAFPFVISLFRDFL